MSCLSQEVVQEQVIELVCEKIVNCERGVVTQEMIVKQEMKPVSTVDRK